MPQKQDKGNPPPGVWVCGCVRGGVPGNGLLPEKPMEMYAKGGYLIGVSEVEAVIMVGKLLMGTYLMPGERSQAGVSSNLLVTSV